MGATGGETLPSERRLLGALVRVSATSTALARRALGSEVHSNLQVATVLTVAELPGAGPAELADRAGVLLPSMSRVLRTLTAAGLVRIVADESDARYRHVFLSHEGRARVARFRESVAVLFRSPEVAEVPAGLGASSAGGDLSSFDQALTRLAGAGSAFVREARRALPQLEELANQTLWPVIALYAEAVPARPAALAAFLEMSRPRATDQLNRLESAGLLVRTRPEGADGRTVELHLTTAGFRVGDAYRDVLRAGSTEVGEALAAAVAAATAGRLSSREAAAGRS